MTTTKEKHKRVCGVCHEPGHNSRTCPKRKAAEATGESVSVAVVAPHVPSAPMSEPDVGALHTPSDFEEYKKYVHVNGLSLSLACREFEGGMTTFGFRIQKDSDDVKDLRLEVDQAAKLYELLGWGLQRHAARVSAPKQLPAAKPVNGAKTTA